MEKTNVITLDDNNKYIIVSKIIIKDVNYYYLVDIHNVKNIKFCQEEQAEDAIILKEINDKEVITNLIKAFYSQEKGKLN